MVWVGLLPRSARCCAFVSLMLIASPALAQTGPSYGTDHGSCDRRALSTLFSTSANNVVGTALGAVAGGIIGNQFGRGSGKSLMTLTGVLAGALAGGAIGRSMEPVDQGCVSQTLEHAPTNQTVAWRNPDNHASYWVTPTETYQREDGTPCRQFTTAAVVNGQRQESTGTACRQPDGTWKIAN